MAKDQTEMAFMENADETVDPVSGNDVPPGSLPEEVRDDIDAKLSEGEYVVPADVVRYYGVKFFENLRTKAKQGLQQMDEDGRIGGEPTSEMSLPFDISELEVEDDDGMRMAVGGLVAAYAVGGYTGVGSSFGGYGGYTGYKPYDPTVQPVTTSTPTPTPVATTTAAPVNTGSQLKTYYDKMGNPVSVMFINGQPQQSLQGLTTSNPNASGDSGPVNVNLNNPLVNDPVSSGTSARQEVDKDNLLNMDSDQLDSYIATQMGKGEGIMERIVPGLVGAAVSTINPLAGLAVGQGMVSRSNLKGLENAEVALKVMESRFGSSENKDVAAARALQKQRIEEQRKGGLADELLSKLYNNADARAKAILESPISSATERDETKKAFSKSAVAPSQQPKYTRSKAEELLGVKTPSLRVETRASDGREAVANSKDPSQYNWEDVNRLRSHDSAANRNKLAQWNREVEAGNAKTGSSKGVGGGGEGSDKIVCTAMNEAYGFGSFRNKIWLTHSAKHLTKAHQVGYHTLFLPLINLGYKKDYKFIRACLENIARHRTSDIYYQSKGSKRDTLGRIYRFTLEPLCYIVGKIVLLKGNKNGN
jgi:Arc/MetJ-type ribon-helix-helix transcriptional regulator